MKEVKKAVEDILAAEEIEVKKTVRKAARKAKEAVEPAVEDAKRAVRRAKLNIIIQSPMGGSISTDAIAAKIPQDADSVYVRVDENMLYWVRGSETEAVNIW